MTQAEYESMRKYVQKLRTDLPDITPAEACELVNKQLAKPIKLAAFRKHFTAAAPKRNGKRSGAVVHVERKNPVITPLEPVPESARPSRLRILFVDAEVGESDLDQLAQTIAALVARPT